MDDEEKNQAAEVVEAAEGAPGSEAEATTHAGLIVVGIGASAGGLHALQQFFDYAPSQTGMAFVVVTHLSPEHVSHLPGLLQSRTAMPVIEVHETVRMAADHVYVVPPNRYLSAIDTHLRLSKTEGAPRPRAPIDHFFRTLADAHGEQAVGLILSGTGSDGTLGIKNIKERGGLIVVQDPGEAEYDGMPQSAIGTGMVDFVLPTRDIPAQLARFAQSQPRLPVPSDGEPAAENAQEMVQKIVAQLRSHVGHDFSRYKDSTITRRIHRRMQIRQVDELGEYLKVLRANRDEVQALFKDLLITVTHFFRDHEAFETLEREVIPKLFAHKTASDSIRVWVVGCATGEEAYSIAMLLLEYAGRLDVRPAIQIFASDISDDALTRGRDGFYPEAIVADVSPQRLERFFVKEAGGYRVKKEVRECVLFTTHNVLKDPPFSRLDLISCRNLLIYVTRDTQRHVFELFHYALQPDGYLFLGPSEATEGSELFRKVNKRHSIFHSVASMVTRLPTMPLAPLNRPAGRGDTAGRPEVASSAATHRRMLARFAPPSILVNSDYNIIHLSDQAGRYLQQPGGEPTNNLLRRALPPLRAELTTMLYGALKKESVARSKAIPLVVDGRRQSVTVSVYPGRDVALEEFALVIFEESGVAGEVEEQPQITLPAEAENATIRDLEEQVEQTNSRLQTTIEEFETSKEEMKAANEELQSINEELRSTGEELETSREELQSTNEELVTLNQENKNKIEELNLLSADLQNLLSATDIATLFLDRELRIRRFTPRISELFNILPADRGRPLAHLTHKLGHATLIADALSVMRTLIPVERELASEDGRWYLTRFLPYRSVDERIDGVVINFIAMTELRQAQQEAQRRARQQAAAVLLGRLALEGVEVDRLLESATQQLCEVLGVEFAEVLEHQPDGAWRLRAGQGWDNALAGQVVARPGEKSLADQTLHAEQPVVVAAWEQEKHVKPAAYLAEQGVASSASVVIRRRQHHLGVLRVHSLRQRAFSQEDVTFLQAVAYLLAVAIERKQIESQLQVLNETLEQQVEQRTADVRDLASELVFSEQRVRQRVSQILHDSLQQVLYATRMHVQMLQEGLPADGAVVAADVAEIRTMVDEALLLTRRLTIDLSPPAVGGQDLAGSLAWLASHMKELHGLEVALEVPPLDETPADDARLLVFQFVRELLFNVVKHAGVKQAQVQVAAEGDNLVLRVSDKGNGFDPAKALQQAAYEGSYGLRTMGERLQLLGGRLDVTSRPGKGATVAVVIPQKKKAGSNEQ